MILAGIVLAEAAILDGRQVVQTQSYGPEYRGGASTSEVIISDKAIDYPKALEPDFFLVLTAEAYRSFAPSMRWGLTIADAEILDLADSLPAPRKAHVVSAPILSLTRRDFGDILAANMVALGVLAALSKAVSQESLFEALRERAPRDFENQNRRALIAGFDLALGGLTQAD